MVPFIGFIQRPGRNFMEYGIAFGSRTKCTDTEKKHALLLVREILELSRKARSAGFIALGQSTESIKNPFLKDGIQLLGKGYDYSAVEKIMNIKISVRDSQGIHLLELAIIKEGILSIMRGDPFSLTEEILFSFLGPKIYKSHLKEQDSKFELYLKRISTSERIAATDPGKWLLHARDNEISFLLKAFEWDHLSLLLKDETEAVLYRVFSNLNSETGKMFRERLALAKSPSEAQLAKVENRFNSIVMKISAGKAVSPSVR